MPDDIIPVLPLKAPEGTELYSEEAKAAGFPDPGNYMDPMPKYEEYTQGHHDKQSELPEEDRDEDFDQTVWKRFREDLLNKIRLRILFDNQCPTHFEGGFCGSGDSGNWDGLYDPNIKREHRHYDMCEAADTLFSEALELFVQFDWYNAEGGGGTITWDIPTDVLNISGYQNVVTEEQMMDEAV